MNKWLNYDGKQIGLSLLRSIIVVLLILCLLPQEARADGPWRFLFLPLFGGPVAWGAIFVGLIVELWFVRLILNTSYLKAMLPTLSMNLVSAINPIDIPMNLLIKVFAGSSMYVGELIKTGFSQPVSTTIIILLCILLYIAESAMDTLIEYSVLLAWKRDFCSHYCAYPKEHGTARFFWLNICSDARSNFNLLFQANLISVILALGAMVYAFIVPHS